MKYIRTKDELGIYVEHDGEYKDLNEGTYFKTWRGFSIHEDWKVADTIKELCDCYLYFTKSGKNWIVTENYETAKLYAERGCKVNACILTDKGLIYVAKMSNRGELELL